MNTPQDILRRAVQWIVDNDEPESLDIDDISAMVTVCLVADLWGYKPERIAELVIATRRWAIRYPFGDLRGARLTEADLRKADLRKADLRGANLSGADLSGADLTDIREHTGEHDDEQVTQ